MIGSKRCLNLMAWIGLLVASTPSSMKCMEVHPEAAAFSLTDSFELAPEHGAGALDRVAEEYVEGKTAPSTRFFRLLDACGTNMQNMTYGYLSDMGKYAIPAYASSEWKYEFSGKDIVIGVVGLVVVGYVQRKQYALKLRKEQRTEATAKVLKGLHKALLRLVTKLPILFPVLKENASGWGTILANIVKIKRSSDKTILVQNLKAFGPKLDGFFRSIGTEFPMLEDADRAALTGGDASHSLGLFGSAFILSKADVLALFDCSARLFYALEGDDAVTIRTAVVSCRTTLERLNDTITDEILAENAHLRPLKEFFDNAVFCLKGASTFFDRTVGEPAARRGAGMGAASGPGGASAVGVPSAADETRLATRRKLRGAPAPAPAPRALVAAQAEGSAVLATAASVGTPMVAQMEEGGAASLVAASGTAEVDTRPLTEQ